MARNVEIKARVRELDAVRSRARALSGAPPELIRQQDTFFHVTSGRLKLRDFGSGRGELIWYRRADERGPRESHYTIWPTADPDGLVAVLSAALGVVGVVRKVRELSLVGQTRIHVDRVERLGVFAELEFVVRDDQTLEDGRCELDRLMTALGLDEGDLVDRAYVDLLDDDHPDPCRGSHTDRVDEV